MSISNANQQFYKNMGIVGICRVFKDELITNGKISKRGIPEIDDFVEQVNKMIENNKEQK